MARRPTHRPKRFLERARARAQRAQEGVAPQSASAFLSIRILLFAFSPLGRICSVPRARRTPPPPLGHWAPRTQSLLLGTRTHITFSPPRARRLLPSDDQKRKAAPAPPEHQATLRRQVPPIPPPPPYIYIYIPPYHTKMASFMSISSTPPLGTPPRGIPPRSRQRPGGRRRAVPVSVPVPASAETEADRAKLASLLRYEVMVRAQDADHAATASHLRPAFDALRELGGEEEEEKEEAGTAGAGRGGAGRRARGRLMGFGGGGGGRRRRAGGGAGAGDGRDALSAAALVGAHRRLRSGTGTEMDILRSDRQLMYVLEELADACSSSGPWGGGNGGWGGSPGGVPPAAAATGADGGGTEAEAEGNNLAFPDFLCAYRTAIAGMQCLQVPDGDAGGGGGEDLERRRRVIDRTALLVRSFGPRRTDGAWGWGGGGGWGGDVGTAPAPPKPATPPSAFSARRLGRTSGRGLRRTTEGGPDGEEGEGSGRGGRGGGTDGGGDEGGPSEARLRHLLAVKDRQMARILSDQNQAADALGAEEGRRRARRGHRRRQRRQWARVGAVLVPALLLSRHWTGIIFRWGGGGEEGGMGAGGPAFSAGSLFRSRSRELADLKRRARIALLESAEKELRIELASTRARLEVAAQDLARARDQVRDALTDASSCGPSGVASPSVALAACRAELRRAR